MKALLVDKLYDIVLDNSFELLSEYMNSLKVNKKRVCIVSDSNVAAFYLDNLKSALITTENTIFSFVFEAGEKSKNLETVNDLYEYLIVNKFDRHDYIIALGGGVVGDLAGYAAATYLRGISFVQIPTTLLSLVDSSIGGKTGVDFKNYKNMIGAFHQPSLVFGNLNTLYTLDRRTFLSGMGEIIKHALIMNHDYFNFIENNYEMILNRDSNVMEELLYESMNIKRIVVLNDPYEKGERAILNFGHTFGHAIEKHTDLSFYHGECVAVGCVLASYISYKRNNISINELNEIIELFDKFDLLDRFRKLNFTKVDFEKIIEYTSNDKKMENGNIKFILLMSYGKAYIDKKVTKDEMYEALEFFFGNEGN